MATRFTTLFSLLVCSFAAEVVFGSDEMVAFMCNRPAMYRNADGWVKDDTTDCLKDPDDILEYCRKVFPDVDVRNIVESSDRVNIDNWCDFGETLCHYQFNVRPFRCLVGPFQSDALLVPEHCIFDHVHDSKLCTSYNDWNQTALQSCVARGHQLQSFAILQPCGVDKFNGVEFVCCPRDKATAKPTTVRPTPTSTLAPTKTATSASSAPAAVVLTDSKNNGDVAEDDSLTRYVYQDVSKNGARHWNEHDYYARARTDMQKHHRDKIANMMKDWSAARQRIQDLKNKDPQGSDKLNKDVTSRFQKMYESEEAEADVEKKQLAVLHQQRVQAELDDRKRRLLQKYVEAVDADEDDVDPTRILKTLTHYVKALQKDRLHILNRYRHLRQTSLKDADLARPQMVDHLANIDRQMTAALHMLDRLPKFKNKIMKQIEEYLDAYHAVDASIMALFGPLEKPSTTPTTATTTTTTTTTPSTTTTTTTTTTTPAPAPLIKDDSDDYDDDDYADYPDYSKSPVNKEEREFKTAMEGGKVKDDDELSKEESEDETEEESEEEEEEEEEDDDDDDDDKNNLTGSPNATPSTSTATATSTAAEEAEKSSSTQRVDFGLFEDRGDERANLDSDSFDYVHVQLPQAIHAGDSMERSPLVAPQPFAPKVQQFKPADSFSAVPLGIAVGCITVFIVIVAGVIVMRRRGNARRHGSARRGHGAPSRLQLDPAASPEERHVAAMQMTGYENPTYKYFEAGSTA